MARTRKQQPVTAAAAATSEQPVATAAATTPISSSTQNATSLPQELIVECITFMPITEMVRMRLLARFVRDGIDAFTCTLQQLNLCNLDTFKLFRKNNRWLEHMLMFIGRQCSSDAQGKRSTCEIKGFVGDKTINKNALLPDGSVTARKCRNICFQNSNIKFLVLPQLPIESEKIIVKDFIYQVTRLTSLEELVIVGYPKFEDGVLSILPHHLEHRGLQCQNLKRLTFIWARSCRMSLDATCPNLEHIMFAFGYSPFFFRRDNDNMHDVESDAQLLVDPEEEALKRKPLRELVAEKDQELDGRMPWTSLKQFTAALLKYMKRVPAKKDVKCVTYCANSVTGMKPRDVVMLCRLYGLDPSSRFNFLDTKLINWDKQTASKESDPRTLLDIIFNRSYSAFSDAEFRELASLLPNPVSDYLTANFWKNFFERGLVIESMIENIRDLERVQTGRSKDLFHKYITAQALKDVLEGIKGTKNEEQDVRTIVDRLTYLAIENWNPFAEDYLAAAASHSAVIQAIIEAQQNVVKKPGFKKAPDAQGEPQQAFLLHKAVQAGALDSIARVLALMSEEAKQQEEQPCLSYKDDHSMLPIHYAFGVTFKGSETAKTDVLAALLTLQRDFSHAETDHPVSKKSLLMLLIEADEFALAMQLLAEHSNLLDINHKDSANNTCLHSCASKGLRGLKLLSLLVDKYGADIEARNSANFSAYDVLSTVHQTSPFTSIFEVPDWLKTKQEPAVTEVAPAPSASQKTSKRAATKRKSRKRQEDSDEADAGSDEEAEESEEEEPKAKATGRGAKRRKL